MKYVPPYGSGNPNAPYVNGDPSTGMQGSIPPAAAFEHPLRELVAAIAAGGLAPDENVLSQLAQAIQSGKSTYAVVTGSANQWFIDPILPIPAYGSGRLLKVVAQDTNTSSVVNANVSSRGNRRLKKMDGSDPAIGDFVGGLAYVLLDDGTNLRSLTPLPSDFKKILAAQQSPFFPEAKTSNGTLASTVATGQIILNAGQSWLHRGSGSVSSDSFTLAERTFATAPSTTYHLRWYASGTGRATPAATYPNGRLVLENLGDSTYNPTALAETNATFDSGYDSMLIARVVTNSGNVLTITPLANRLVIFSEQGATRTSALNPGAFNWAAYTGEGRCGFSFTYDWARTPQIMMPSGVIALTGSSAPIYTSQFQNKMQTAAATTRYQAFWEIYSHWLPSSVWGPGPVFLPTAYEASLSVRFIA